MAESQTGTRVFPSTLALLLAVIGAASMVYYHQGLFMPRVHEVNASRNLGGGYAFGDDFYPIWLTSRDCMRTGCDLYSEEMTRKIQTGLFGRALDSRVVSDPRTDYRTMAYPAFTDILLWPASLLPFAVVRVLLVFFLAALTSASIVLWTRALHMHLHWIWLIVAVLLTLCSYPVLEGLYADQLGLLVGFLLAAAILALLRGRLLLAGIVMALTTIKPQMTLLVLVYLGLWSLHDWRRRSRFGVAFLFTMLVLVGSALIIWPHWIFSWMQVVRGYHRYARPPMVGELLAMPLGRLANTFTLIIIAILLVVAVALAWRNRAATAGSRDFWLTLSLLLSITSVTLLPGQAIHDEVILLPGVLLLAWPAKTPTGSWIMKALRVITAAAVVWPWFAAFILIVLHPLLTEQVFSSQLIFAMPIRTAAVFPFLVLALLAMTARAEPRETA
jgi:hypothetical protein